MEQLQALLGMIKYKDIVMVVFVGSFAMLAWFLRGKNWKGAGVAAVFCVVGVVMLVNQVQTDNAATLFEDERSMKEVESKEKQVENGKTIVEMVPDAPIKFEIEHPNVEHVLNIFPPRETSIPEEKLVVGEKKSTTYHVQLLRPDNSCSFEIDVPYSQHCDQYKVVRKKLYTDITDCKFTPTQAGMHELKLTAIGEPFEDVHIHVTDPKKTDGKRMAGY